VKSMKIIVIAAMMMMAAACASEDAGHESKEEEQSNEAETEEVNQGNDDVTEGPGTDDANEEDKVTNETVEEVAADGEMEEAGNDATKEEGVENEAAEDGSVEETASDGLHDVIEQTLAKTDAVERYELEISMLFGVDAFGQTDESTASIAGRLDESTGNGYLETREEQLGQQTETAVYFVDNESYANIDNQGWREETMMAEDWSTSYGNVAAVLRGMGAAEVEETNEHFEVTYTGNDLAVFNAFKDPFSLSVDGFDVENDVEFGVAILIHKDEFIIDDLSFTIAAENESGNAEAKITVDYENINAIDDIEIPEEVREEASEAAGE
jgi:hypothetical protein